MPKMKAKAPKIEVIKPMKKLEPEEERKDEREELAVKLRASDLTVDEKRACVRRFLGG